VGLTDHPVADDAEENALQNTADRQSKNNEQDTNRFKD
jgi:hypothetical protein